MTKKCKNKQKKCDQGIGLNGIAVETKSLPFHRRFIYKGDTSTHAEGTDPRVALSERARVRRHYAPPLCLTLVAAKSGRICIAVVLINVSGGVIVLSSERLRRECNIYP